MRILFVASWYPTPQTPFDGSFFREQAQFLRAAGHEVTVLAPRAVPAPKWRHPRPRITTEDGLRVIRFDLPVYPLGLGPIEAAIHHKIGREIATFLRRTQQVPDVCHAHSIFPALLITSNIARNLERPVVFTEHRPSSMQRRTWGVRGRRIRTGINTAAITTTVSQAFATALTQHWGRDFELLELPVPDHFFTSKRTHHPGRILHISHLDPGKCVPDLIAAYNQLKPAHPELELVIGGGTPELIAPLKELAAASPHSGSITFTGALNRDEVATLMASAAIFVLPSEVEAGGTVIGEAQASGTPVVATRTWAGTSMTMTQYGALAEIHDPTSLAAAIATVIAKNPDPHTVRSNARDRFSTDTFVHRCEDYYQRAISCQ